MLRDDFFIPPLSFDADEAAALMLGLRFVLRRGDADLSNAATRARAKLAAVLPARFDDSAAARSPHRYNASINSALSCSLVGSSETSSCNSLTTRR